MSSIQDDLNSFTRFAAERVANVAADASLMDLFMQWHDAQHRDEIQRAIRRGLADVDAGRHVDAAEATAAIGRKFGFHD